MVSIYNIIINILSLKNIYRAFKIFCCIYRSVPTILGKKPKASKFHSAVLVTDDRILILTGDSSANEFAHFLEVFSSLYRINFGTIGPVAVKFAMLHAFFLKIFIFILWYKCEPRFVNSYVLSIVPNFSPK